MFEYLKKVFSSDTLEERQQSTSDVKKSTDKKIQIAACALFIEMAKTDGVFAEEEKTFIVSEMKKTFNLDNECTKELIELAEREISDSVSIYEFTSVINEALDQEQKILLIESLWRLIYQDEKLNAYEDQLMKRIAATLNIEHKQIINSKLWVKQQLGLR